MTIGRTFAREAMSHGALAVLVTGSAVSGRRHAHSDVDLIVVLRRGATDADRDGWLRSSRMRRGRLVTVAATTPAEVRRAFRDPERATTFVPGWRDAVVIADTEGVAARLKRAATRWTWEAIARACDAHVADSITGLAEEAHKLAGMYATGSHLAAAAQRDLLAVFLAGTLAIHRRVLFGTDNVLWDRVGEAMGPRWRRDQRRAFAMEGQPLVVSCRAALALYAMAADEVWPLLDREQRAVVTAAARLRIR